MLEKKEGVIDLNIKEKPLDRLHRWAFNLYPAHWFSGGRMKFIAEDYSFCRVWIKKTWRTRGVFGNIFGGNLYAGIDAMPLALLHKRLGHKRFVLWDRSGEIRYLKPAFCKVLVADITLDESSFNAALADIEQGNAGNVTFEFSICCPNGTPYASVTKVVHMECRKRFNARKKPAQPHTA